MGNPRTDLPSHSGTPLEVQGGGKGALWRLGLGCAARAGNREGICVCPAHAARVSWHALKTIDVTPVVPRSKSDHSLDQLPSRGAPGGCRACGPELHFVVAPGFPFLVGPCQGC